MELRRCCLCTCLNVHKRCEFIVALFFILFVIVFMSIAITSEGGDGEEGDLILSEYVGAHRGMLPPLPPPSPSLPPSPLLPHGIPPPPFRYIHLLAFFGLGLLAFGSFASRIATLGDELVGKGGGGGGEV